MKQLLLFIAITLMSETSFGQLSQNDFIIGTYWAPSLYTDATPAPADYDGDGAVDLASKTNSGSKIGQWRIDYSTPTGTPIIGQFKAEGWDYQSAVNKYGDAASVPVPADYDGNGKADIAVYNINTRKLSIYLRNSANNGFANTSIDIQYPLTVLTSAKPFPGDFNGDGNIDMSFKQNDGKWLIDYSNQNGTGNIDWTGTIYGDENSIPVPADYNGDGKIDLSIKNNSGEWKVDFAPFNSWNITQSLGSTYNNIVAYPVPADFDGDNKADFSFVNQTPLIDIAWTIYFSDNSYIPVTYTIDQIVNIVFTPIPKDYNGDGNADLSVCLNNPRVGSADGKWFIDYDFNSTNNYLSNEGKLGDNFNKILTAPYYEFDIVDIDNLNKIKDCNINLVIDQMVVQSDKQNDYYLALLNNISGTTAPGLNVLLSNGPIAEFKDQAKTSIANIAFVDHYQTLPSDLQKHIYGVFLGDEPHLDGYSDDHPADMTHLKGWSDFFESTDGWPEKPTFTNLLPRYGYSTNVQYQEYLQTYKVSDPNSPFISFDFYPFFVEANIPKFFTNYFYNLFILKNLFPDRKLVSTVLAAPDANHLDPTEEQLRLMAFCPISYGAKGITYYPFANKNNVTEITNTPYDDATKYNSIRNINTYLKNIVAPVVMNSVNIATLHKANTSFNEGYPLDQSELVSNYGGLVTDLSDTNALTGIFAMDLKNTDPKIFRVGDYALWVANKSTTTAINNLVVSLRGNYSNNVTIAPRVLNYLSSPVTTYANVSVSYNSLTDISTLTIPVLDKGEGRMLKIFSNNNIPTPADYDGDHIMDISIKENNGTWLIDYSANGFGKWDFWGHSYGNQTAHPAIADYDGDGKADISVKTDDQYWLIDYSTNGFTGWDFNATGYGNVTAHPVPADYDGDGNADISVKTDDEHWYIDFSTNGRGAWDYSGSGYGGTDAHPVPGYFSSDNKADLSVKFDNGDWKFDFSIPSGTLANNFGFSGLEPTPVFSGFGNQTSHAAPANYDGDASNYTDLSIKTDNGDWKIDYWSNGLGTWDVLVTGYGNQTAIPVPGDYGGNGSADLSVKTDDGRWLIDYSSNGYGTWDDIILNPPGSSPGFVSGNSQVTKTAIKGKGEQAFLNGNAAYKFLNIYNLAGKQMFAVNKTCTIKELQRSLHLSPGLYLVSYMKDNRVATTKLLIQPN